MIIRICLAALLAGATVTAMAQEPAPFAKGDPHKGEKLVTKDCESCHASKFGGDPTAIYLRKDRRVKNASQLLSQVHDVQHATQRRLLPRRREGRRRLPEPALLPLQAMTLQPGIGRTCGAALHAGCSATAGRRARERTRGAFRLVAARRRHRESPDFHGLPRDDRLRERASHSSPIARTTIPTWRSRTTAASSRGRRMMPAASRETT